MRKAKALIVNPYWDTLGGGERYTSTVIKCLLKHGWKVDVLGNQTISESVKERFGIDISSCSFVSADIYTANYDLVFWVSDGSLPLSFSKRTLVHFQFPFRSINGKKITNTIKSKFYKFAVNSLFTKKHIDNEFGINSQILYPPVDINKFTPGVKEKTILYVGRFSQLTQLKNPHILVEQFIKLHKTHKEWKLVLAGGVGVGSESSYLSTIKSMSKNYPISVIENPSLKQLQGLYSAASIFWSAAGFGVDEESEPTKVEHFGMSLVESMSAGAVPVVSNLGGHKEIIEGKYGFLCNKPDDLHQLTNMLILKPETLKKISHLVQIRSKLYSIDIFEKTLFEIIK